MMGLDMYVEKIVDTMLLKKYTANQLYQFMQVHELHEVLTACTFLYKQTNQYRLNVEEIKQLIQDTPISWKLMATSREEYIDLFERKIFRIKEQLTRLPSLPLDFPKHPPKLSTIESKYWREATAIHNWFVKHVQNGVDDCGYYSINYLTMTRLNRIINLILNESDELEQRKLIQHYLPPTDDFLFGGTDVDEYYFGYLEETLDWLENDIDWNGLVNEEVAYVYTSSW